MKEPILSIIIPTYNRPQQVKEQVKSLLPQLSQEVKLIIRDNCSPTPVKFLFSSEELEKITVCRNDVNIGGDANIARCLELCETNWAWVLGDDDYVNNEAVKIVLEAINKYSDYVWLNFECSEHIDIKTPDAFFYSMHTLTEFSNSFWISKCIYNTSKLRPYISAYYESLSSMMGQLALLLRYCIDTKSFKGHKFKTCIFISHDAAGWDFSTFVKRTSVMFINFGEYRERELRPVFKGLTHHRLILIDPDTRNKYSLLYKVIKEYGIINTIKDFKRLVLKSLIRFHIPKLIKKFISVSK